MFSIYEPSSLLDQRILDALIAEVIEQLFLLLQSLNALEVNNKLMIQPKNAAQGYSYFEFFFCVILLLSVLFHR